MATMTHQGAGPTSTPKRGRGRWWRLLLVLGLAAAGWWYAADRPVEPVQEKEQVALRFAEVISTDLTEIESYEGILGRGDGRPIVNYASGTLTGAATPGTVVASGEELYRVDNYPVVLLHGELPAWRRLADSVEDGADVQQLEAALVDLGYDPDETVSVDEEFTSFTARMVQRWQEDLGVDDDGAVELGEVVFLSGEVRIADVLVELGSPVQAGTQLLRTSSAEIVVTVDLPTADQGVLSEGDAVSVVLPDDTRTGGTVVAVGTIATTDAQGMATVEVEVELDDPTSAGNLDEAPVEIEVVVDSVQAATAVPVTALVALAEGGYAVQVAEPDGTLRLTAVEPGFFADGLVEITAEAVQPGDRVVIP